MRNRRAKFAILISAAALAGQPLREWDFWFIFLIPFFILFVLADNLIFDYISE